VRVEVEKIRFDHDADQKSGAGAELSCFVVLGLDAAASLWVRSEVIARMLDFVQAFVDQSRQLKEVHVLTGQAQNRPKGPVRPADKAAPSGEAGTITPPPVP
jgi:hypothetical protein